MKPSEPVWEEFLKEIEAMGRVFEDMKPVQEGPSIPERQPLPKARVVKRHFWSGRW